MMGNLSNPQHREWFTDEFLFRPGPFWEVELPKLPKLRNVFGSYFQLGWIGWPKGTVVRFQGYPSGDCTRAYVWVLTGQHDVERDCYEGIWPD